jgi:nucleotide-binding universal stress UspA family protein
LEKRKTLMFKRIVVAYNESPEASRALASAIQLAKLVEAELQVVTVVQELPAYTAYATAGDSSLTRTLREDRSQGYEQMQAAVRETALREGVAPVTHLLEGDEVDALVGFLLRDKPDLLVIGLHPHASHVSRLWSRVYGIAQDAPCSVLGVH